MYLKLGDTIHGVFGTNAFADGSATDADSLPTCVVLDEGSPMAYAPTVTHVDTGLYDVEVDATTGNGFVVGHQYSLYVVVVVGGSTTRAPVDGISSFNVTARDPDDLDVPTLDGGVTLSKNEATAGKRRVTVYVSTADGTAPAPRDTDFADCVTLDRSSGVYVPAAGPLVNAFDELAMADQTFTWSSGNNVTATSHPYENGDGPFTFTTTGALPTPLAVAPYQAWIIVVDGNTIAFATTLAHAYAGTKIALSGSSSGTNKVTATGVASPGSLRPLDGVFVYPATQAETDFDGSELVVRVVKDGFALALARATFAGSVNVASFDDGAITAEAFGDDALALLGVDVVDLETGGAFSRTSVQLDFASTSSVNDFYTGAMLYVVSGTGAGGWATIDAYTNTSGEHVCSLAGAGLPVAPDEDSVCAVIRNPRYFPGDAVADLIDGPSSTVEGSNTLGDMVRLMASMMAGPVTDFRTGLLVFKSLDGSKTRLTGTTDASGRISIVLGDLT